MRLRRWMIGALLGATLGLHWGALQVVAWTGMLIDYTATYGLADGFSKTFDGSVPCELCTAIEAATTQDSDPMAPQPPRFDANQWYLPAPQPSLRPAGAGQVTEGMRQASVAVGGLWPTPEPPPPRQRHTI